MNALGFNDAEKMHVVDAGTAYELAALKQHGLILWKHGLDCPAGDEEWRTDLAGRFQSTDRDRKEPVRQMGATSLWRTATTLAIVQSVANGTVKAGSEKNEV